jgi:uncharacterized membrane protein YcjF (UPF0283 family)
MAFESFFRDLLQLEHSMSWPSDGFIQQMFDHSIADRLSAGVCFDGFSTTRLGLAAIDVVRPLPFKRRRRRELPIYRVFRAVRSGA